MLLHLFFIQKFFYLLQRTVMAKESCFLFAAAKREKYAATCWQLRQSVPTNKRSPSSSFPRTFYEQLALVMPWTLPVSSPITNLSMFRKSREEFCFFNAHPILTLLTFCLFCPTDVLILESGFESSSLTISAYWCLMWSNCLPVEGTNVMADFKMFLKPCRAWFINANTPINRTVEWHPSFTFFHSCVTSLLITAFGNRCHYACVQTFVSKGLLYVQFWNIDCSVIFQPFSFANLVWTLWHFYNTHSTSLYSAVTFQASLQIKRCENVVLCLCHIAFSMLFHYCCLTITYILWHIDR